MTTRWHQGTIAPRALKQKRNNYSKHRNGYTRWSCRQARAYVRAPLKHAHPRAAGSLPTQTPARTQKKRPTSTTGWPRPTRTRSLATPPSEGLYAPNKSEKGARLNHPTPQDKRRRQPRAQQCAHEAQRSAQPRGRTEVSHCAHVRRQLVEESSRRRHAARAEVHQPRRGRQRAHSAKVPRAEARRRRRA